MGIFQPRMTRMARILEQKVAKIAEELNEGLRKFFRFGGTMKSTNIVEICGWLEM